MEKIFRSNLPPSIFNAYNICKRQAWLMIRQLNADQDNTFLNIGKLIDKTSFKREKKRVYIADISAQIDMITKKNGTLFVAEIKKSSKTLKSGEFQLKYYLYLLKLKGINIKGLIKIPREKKSIEIELNNEDIDKISKIIKEANSILNKEIPPEIKKIKLCKTCAHYEFCWS